MENNSASLIFITKSKVIIKIEKRVILKSLNWMFNDIRDI